MIADRQPPTNGGSSFVNMSDLPAASTSAAAMEPDAPRALAYLKSRDALDLAPMLGLGGVA